MDEDTGLDEEILSMGHHDATVPAAEVAAPEGIWKRLPLVGSVLGALFLLLTFVIGRDNLPQLYHSYLVAFLFFLTFGLGGLFFTLVQYATRAGWSVVVRRLAENAAATLPLFLPLFIPIALGYHDLFHWSHAEAVAHDPLLQHKTPYLNSTFFFVRAAIYLVSWTFLGWWLRAQSVRQDEEGGTRITRKLQSLSPLGLIVFALTSTFAAFDWIMSLDPHWYSTIFGVYFFAGCVIAICALLSLMGLKLQGDGRLNQVVTWEHFHDIGKLLFAFTVFWAYIAFSQFMLIWYGNIPEETAFFAHRWEHGWKPVSIFLAAGHFGAPFLFMLSSDVKRHRLTLMAASAWMIAMHYLDLFWLVMPSLHGDHFTFHPLDVTALLGVGGLWIALLAWISGRGSLVPLKDPRLAESLAFENV